MPDPLRHVRALAEEIGPREATGPGEARAARYIAEAARAYTHQVWMEPFRSFESPEHPRLLIQALVLTGFLLLLVSWHLAAVISTFSTVLWLGQSLRWIELGWLFRRRESRNVVAVVPSTGAIRRRLILLAHIDSPGVPPVPWQLAAVGGAGILLLPVFTVLAAGTGSPAWAWLACIPGAAILVGAAAYVRAGLCGVAAGGGDAAGAALGLAAGAALAQAPLRHTEVWTVFTGCREPGMTGLRALLDRYGHMLADADFVVLDRIGPGAPVYTLTEGIFPARMSESELTGYMAELRLTGVPLVHHETQAALLIDSGLRAVSLTAPGEGRPGARTLHDLVRLLQALGAAIDRDACAEAEAEPAGM